MSNPTLIRRPQNRTTNRLVSSVSLLIKNERPVLGVLLLLLLVRHGGCRCGCYHCTCVCNVSFKAWFSFRCATVFKRPWSKKKAKQECVGGNKKAPKREKNKHNYMHSYQRGREERVTRPHEKETARKSDQQPAASSTPACNQFSFIRPAGRHSQSHTPVKFRPLPPKVSISSGLDIQT